MTIDGGLTVVRMVDKLWVRWTFVGVCSNVPRFLGRNCRSVVR
jgi:hypothetical protein